MKIIPKAKAAFSLLGLLPLALALVAAAPRPAAGDFSGWHLPLPAGRWIISRGPCGSAARFNHDCRYYEESCALDLVPVSGSMENVPVLAPQAGQVLFVGRRNDAGLMVMVLHPDGRVSGLMHLAKAVVRLDEPVRPGQVLGYAGSTGSSGNPHLHFFVQPNAVERECADLRALDGLDFLKMTAVSRNLAWPDLTLTDPPAVLPGWLPALAAPPSALLLPKQLTLVAGVPMTLPVAAPSEVNGLVLGKKIIWPVRGVTPYPVFQVPLTVTAAGEYTQTVVALGRACPACLTATLTYTVRLSAAAPVISDVIQVNPFFLSPESMTTVDRPPRFCWQVPASAGRAPLQYRVMVAGPAAIDSGWINTSCWQPPSVGAGRYWWKVFVRDARGYMNRTNQRPYLMVLR